MKKCASCTKDLPDAALHCVFCGAKQPPAPATTGGLAKTVMGSYSASDMMEQLKQQPGGVPQPGAAMRPAPPQQPMQPQPPQQPPYQPPRAPSGHAATQLANPNQNPYQPPQQPQQPQPPPMHQPPQQPQYGAPQAPTAPSSAATMFVPGGGGGPPQGNFGPGPGPARPMQPPQQQPTMHAPPQPYQPPQQPYQPPGAGAYNAAPGPAPMYPQAPPQQPYQPPQQPYQPPQQQYQQPRQLGPTPSPPYLASQTAARAGRPIEPWKDSLRMMMFIWGGALLLAFVVPLTTDPMSFHWDTIINGEGKMKLPPLIMAAVGLLSIVLALIPTSPAPRGLIAGVLGLAGVLIPMFLAGMPEWKALVALAGLIVLIPSLFLRQEYRESMLPRVLITLGAIGVLLPYLLPVHGELPLVAIFEGAIEAPGSAKVLFLMMIAYIMIVVLTLLAWLPSPASGGAKVFAWLLILWPLLVLLVGMLLSGNIGDVISKTPNAIVAWVAGGLGAGTKAAAGMALLGASLGVSYAVLIGYGFATIVGKKLE